MTLRPERQRIRSTTTDRALEFNRREQREQRPGISSSVSCLFRLGPKLRETAGASAFRLTSGKVEYSFSVSSVCSCSHLPPPKKFVMHPNGSVRSICPRQTFADLLV